MSNDHDIDMWLLLSHLAKDLQPKPHHKKIINAVNNKLQSKKMTIQQTLQESKPWCTKEIGMQANRDMTKKNENKKIKM
jgi:hypothetical protein